MEKEISFLGEALLNPQKPFYAIIGGAKISTKIGVLKSLIGKVNGIFIGGGMAFTFLKAQGLTIGNSLCEDEHLAIAKEIIESCKNQNIRLILPTDHVVANAFSNLAKSQVVSAKEGISSGWRGMDVGPQTISEVLEMIKDAKTVLWNGPVGKFEVEEFAAGTKAIAKVLGSLKDATTIAGGGETVQAIHEAGLESAFSHISTGGGASLEFIEQGTLPGIEALE